MIVNACSFFVQEAMRCISPDIHRVPKKHKDILLKPLYFFENLLFTINGSEIKKKKRSITNCRL